MNPKLKKTAVWVPLVIAVTFVIGMIAGNYFSRRQAGGPVERKISDIVNLIQSDYVDDVNTDSLLEKTIPDLLSKLGNSPRPMRCSKDRSEGSEWYSI